MSDKYQPLRDALAESSAYFRFPGECTYCKPDGPAANMLRALLADYDRLQRELEFIAYANPSRWDADMRDQFQEWAQNRARAALADGEGN